MTPLRIVFDTNAFMQGNFELLEQGPMRKLCHSGRIVPVYSDALIEETLNAYMIERKRDDLIKRWLPFIVDTAGQKICKLLDSIWHEELVQGRGLNARIFMTRRDYERFVEGISSIPMDGSWELWHSSQSERDIEKKKRASMREVLGLMRQEIADRPKSAGYHSEKYGASNLGIFLESEVDYTGDQLIHSIFKANGPHAISGRWSRAKKQYPYFSQFVVNNLYMAYHAMTKSNNALDENAQVDLDLMTRLLHADVLVSNEKGFLKCAFNDLWRPQRKVLFTSSEFADFMQKL
jgi:hypothetical protein